MQPERARTDGPHFQLPQDLLAEVQRRGSPRRNDFHVEGWKPSVFERFLGKLIGRK